MKSSVMSLLMSAFLFFSVSAGAVLPFERYVNKFRQAMQDCSISYSMKCSYPDSSSISVQGVMAVKRNQYYDSSNARFVLLNDHWYLVADHINKFIAVAHLPQLNRLFEGVGTLKSSSWLFSDEFFKEHVSFSIKKENTEFVWIELKMSESKTLDYLEIQVSRKDFLPTGYTARINYPMPDLAGEDGEAAVMKIDFTATKISFPAPAHLFTHGRIIKESKDRATLRRYNNYRTVSSN